MYCFSQLRRLSSAAREVSLYALLEVAPSASASEIKRAFRQKAKLHHPDVSQTRSDSTRFARILVAYQVLSDDRQRQLYDLSLKSSSSPIHNAAKQGTRPNSTATEQEGEWVPGAGWFAWATRTPQAPAANQVDKLRAELRNEFNAAVRHAYLGPRVEVGTDQLPEAFEGEERSIAGVGDVLQLVSGQQLLGVVRERQDARLPGAVGALDRELARHLDSGTTNSSAPSAEHDSDDISSPFSSAHSRHSGTEQAQQGRAWYTGPPTSPILELLLEGKPVAVAVRRHGRLSHAKAQTPSSHVGHIHADDDHNWQHYNTQTCGTESAVADGQEKGPWTCFYDMDGTVLAIERDGNLHKGGVAGPHTHTVLTGQTPLVRHLHVVSIAGGQELSICRCRRAWLPPSSTWLFPPRSQDHTTGGWYFEWSGHVFHKHAAWLHPAVFVLLAAFDTLGHEDHARTTGMHATAGDRRDEQPDSRMQQFKQWVSSMWRFHWGG
ncbi:hypothetical protein ABBQ32_008439 [Trebouxia sp. C0010 RCD-2024]